MEAWLPLLVSLSTYTRLSDLKHAWVTPLYWIQRPTRTVHFSLSPIFFQGTREIYFNSFSQRQDSPPCSMEGKMTLGEFKRLSQDHKQQVGVSFSAEPMRGQTIPLTATRIAISPQ